MMFITALQLLFSTNVSFGQKELKNAVYLIHSPTHFFYDGAGIINSPNQNEDWTLSQLIARRRFSHGIKYARKLNAKYSISIGMASYSGAFTKEKLDYLANTHDRIKKHYIGVDLGVTRSYELNKKNKWGVGVGITGRKIHDELVYSNGQCPNCILFYPRHIRFEFGALVNLGLEHQWTRWLKTFIELRHNLIIHQQHEHNRIYFLDKGVPKSFFSRNETMLNVGLGFSF